MSGKKLTKKEKEDRRIIKGLKSDDEMKSTLMDDELNIRKYRIDRVPVDAEKSTANKKAYYRNFVIRCTKCKEEFKHEAESEHPAEQVICPKCGIVHDIDVCCGETCYDIEFPMTLEIISEGD